MSAHPEVTEARERIGRKRGGNSWKGTRGEALSHLAGWNWRVGGLVTNGRYSRARSKNLVNKTVVPPVYSASWLNFHLFHASSPRSRPSLTCCSTFVAHVVCTGFHELCHALISLTLTVDPSHSIVTYCNYSLIVIILYLL